MSTFADLNTRGFGLMRRQKNFFAYEDIEFSFEKRPSRWAEPIGVHDNIAGFWRPKNPLQAKAEHTYTPIAYILAPMR